MSRQEVYAWAGILSSISFLLLYLVLAFGIPSVLEPIEGGLIRVITIIIVVDLVVQTVISAQQSRSGRIDKDERDMQIEAKGYKNAYRIFVVAIIILIGQLFITDFMRPFADGSYLGAMDALTIHYLVVVFFLGTSAKAVTQVVLYRRAA